LAVAGIFVSGLLSEFCSVGLLGFFALMISWYRFVPEQVRWFLTIGPVMIVLDIGAWYLGWTVLPDAITAKGAFIVMHILFSTFLIFESKRIRKTLFKPERRRFLSR
jgi:hypothetical protein